MVEGMCVVGDKWWVWLYGCLIECSCFEGGDCVGEGAGSWSTLSCTAFNVDDDDTMWGCDAEMIQV